MTNFKLDAAPAVWNPAVTVIRLQGSIDAQAAPQFEETALSIIGGSKSKQILVDCSELEFISSAGLGVFMVLLDAVEGHGFLRLMNLSPNVYEPFELLGLDELLEILRNEEEAKQACV